MTLRSDHRTRDTSLLGFIKSDLLRPLKAAAKDTLRHRAFRRYMNQAARSPSLLDDRDFLAEIRAAWGNVDYSADVSFLGEALGRVRGLAGGAVLECGSGISTILMGLLISGGATREIVTFESDAQWFNRVISVTRQYRFTNVQLVHAPLQSYGDYMWYGAPLRAPRGWSRRGGVGAQPMPRFDLVICDGPTEATPGGRYGLLPIMARHLSEDAVVLLDDADTKTGRDVLARWENEGLVARCELRDSTDGAFGIVTVKNIR